MKQKDKKNKLSGAEGFDSYYSEIFGSRWNLLKSSLYGENQLTEFNAGGSESYFLDSASVRAAVTLPLKNARTVLDMCAAPGGKTIVLASCMEENAGLLANERSPERKIRLFHSVQNCLPENVKKRVNVICKDGATLCLAESNRFDRILLDAPCSSERHVLCDLNYLKDWSPSRIKTLAIAQWSLLSSAWRMLNVDGYMVYSTCALNPDENDNIIKKLLKKFDDVEICEPKISSDVSGFCNAFLPEGEKTEFGSHVLPDFCNGAGPLYFSLLHKI